MHIFHTYDTWSCHVTNDAIKMPAMCKLQVLKVLSVKESIVLTNGHIMRYICLLYDKQLFRSQRIYCIHCVYGHCTISH